MKPRSLTARVLISAFAWIALAMGLGGYGVYEVFRASAVRQFDMRLEQELDSLTAAIAFRPWRPGERMRSPGFQRLYSGYYWQANQWSADGAAQFFASRSLGGFILPVGGDYGRIERGEIDGPDGQRLRYLATAATFEDGAWWSLTAAADLAWLEDEQAGIRRSLWLAAGLLGLSMAVAAVLLLRAALSPLAGLRRAVRRLGEETVAASEAFPTEVAPLVADLNAAFEKNLRLRERGRLQAANLAHALKTPASILRNEVDRAAAGEAMDLAAAAAAIDRIAEATDAHLRTAGVGGRDAARAAPVDAAAILREVTGAVARLFPHLRFRVAAPDRFDLAIPENALHEILGNLVENAGKWARSEIQVSLTPDRRGAMFRIDDDGPGVPEDQRRRALVHGVRFDESKPGAGLGLAIVADLVDQSDGELALKTAPLGGLRAEVLLPARGE